MLQALRDRAQVLSDLGVDSEGLSQIGLYLEHLKSANQELNLVSRKMTDQELVDNHVIDCLLALPFWPREIRTVADLGSGGGLPGVLFAILHPQVSFCLYEKSPKKQHFLKSCLSFAPNLTVAGEIPPSLSGVDLVMARAFKPLDVILDLSRDYYNGGGKYFLLKGRREKINEEIQCAQKKFPKLSVRVVPLTSPVLARERHLVLISKCA